MFASQILPDLQTVLPNVEFGQRLEIHVDVPADNQAATITVRADGQVVLPVAGEIRTETL